jgi:4-amino-4-deoxy-L-arabinose transferase-like glycosyltransferase
MAQAQSLLDAAARPAGLFALAFAVRLVYLAASGASPEASFHPDSPLFLELAQSPEWWQGSSERMPGYPIFLRLHFTLFGPTAYWAPLVSQMALDALACVAIARTAEIVRPGAGRWAGWFAAANPTQIVMAGVLLGDSIFMACLAGGFLALARWCRAGAQFAGALAVGVWFGLALFNRAILWPFVPVLGLAMLALAVRARGSLASPIAALTIVTAFAAPMVARNAMVHGEFALSSQGPIHMAMWWYPLVKEAHDGTPYARTAQAVTERFGERGGGAGGFADAAIYGGIARDGLAELPPDAYAKAWAMGAAINLASPATLMIPSVMALPRTGFYATPGDTPADKIANFLTESSSADYLAWLAFGAALEWPVRLLGVAGLWFAWRARAIRTVAVFAVLWIGFVLAVQGPVAAAKYRLPIEPVAMALAGLALARRPNERA